MPVLYKEFGHKGSTRLMQVVEIPAGKFLLSKEGTVHEHKAGLPEITDKKVIAAVKKAGK